MAIRVFELAKELGVTSDMVLDKCRAKGIDLKNHMATLSRGLEADIRQWFAEDAAPASIGEMQRIAERVAAADIESEPTIQRVFWFPNLEEVRLVEVMPDTIPSEEVVAFHFGPDLPGGIPVPFAVALVLPQEVGAIPVPKGWVDWKDAKELYPIGAVNG
jgi:hypothetical protein